MTKSYNPCTYPEMLNRVFATVERDEGFNGGVVRVGLALFDGDLFEVGSCGYYHSAHATGKVFATPKEAVIFARQCKYFRDLRIEPIGAFLPA